MYNLNKDWYTEVPTNQTDLSKLLLILHTYGFYSTLEKLDPYYPWIGSGSTKKKVTKYSKNVKAIDFHNAGYIHIPLEYLLSL